MAAYVRVATYPAVQLSTSAWEEIPALERAACINETHFRQVEDEKAFDPDGRLLQVWTTTVCPSLKRVVEDHRADILRSIKKKKLPPFVIHFWMMGKTFDTARPTVVVLSNDRKVSRRMVELIVECDGFKDLGFDTRAYEKSIYQHKGGGRGEFSPLPCLLCGSMILAASSPNDLPSHGRKVTIGGVIALNSEYFGLTVAHPFFQQSDENEDEEAEAEADVDELNSEAEIDSMSPSSSTVRDNAATENELNPAVTNVYFPPPDENTEPVFVGHLRRQLSGAISASAAGFDGSLCEELDWALVEIDEKHDDVYNRIILPNKKTLSPRAIASIPPPKCIWVAAGASGVRESWVSNSVCVIYLSGSKMQDAWTLDLETGM